MPRKLLLIACAFASVQLAGALPGQAQSTLPKKSLQPREAQQPTTTTAPPLKQKTPAERPPRLTDGAIDDTGRELESTDEGRTGPAESTEVLRTSLRARNPDLVMATWIALAHQEEMALAALGAERAENSVVRQYAAKVADQQADLLAKLKRFAPEATRDGYLNTTAPDARSVEVARPAAAPSRVIDRLSDDKLVEEEPAPTVGRATGVRPRTLSDAVAVPRTAARPLSPVARDFNVVQIERELAVQSLASSKEMLADKTGADFDQWFLAQQVGIHKALRDRLIIYQRHVASDLAAVLAEDEQVTLANLAEVRELLMPSATEPAADEPAPRKAEPRPAR